MILIVICLLITVFTFFWLINTNNEPKYDSDYRRHLESILNKFKSFYYDCYYSDTINDLNNELIEIDKLYTDSLSSALEFSKLTKLSNYKKMKEKIDAEYLRVSIEYLNKKYSVNSRNYIMLTNKQNFKIIW